MSDDNHNEANDSNCTADLCAEELSDIAEFLGVDDCACAQDLGEDAQLVLSTGGELFVVLYDKDRDAEIVVLVGPALQSLKKLVAGAEHLLTHIN